MADFPKTGMYYNQVAQRLKRIKKETPEGQMKKNLVDSLVGQVSRAEGKDAGDEIAREYNNENHSLNRVGTTPQYRESWDRIFGNKNGSGSS